MTDKGILQTLELSSMVDIICPRTTVSSPSARAVETLELLKPKLTRPGQAVAIDDRLQEVAIGRWEGQLKSELENRFPDEIDLWRTAPWHFVDDDGRRPLLGLYDRVAEFVEDAHMEPDNCLVIGHDHVNRAMIGRLLNLPITSHLSIPQGISSLSSVSYATGLAAPALQLSNLEHAAGEAMPMEARSEEPRLLLVRHGTTAANRERIYQGSEDVPLDWMGEEQAGDLEKLIAETKPAVIISSHLQRARRTAALLPFAACIDRQVDQRLAEYDYGPWTGMSDDDVQRLHPEAVANWRLLSSDRPISGGEPISHLVARVSGALNALWGRALKEGTIIVVAHDVVIRAIIVLSLQLSIRNLWSFPIENGAVSVISLAPPRAPVLRHHNILPGRLEGRYGRRFL